MAERFFEIDVAPDAEAFLANLRRRGTPRRVHIQELFLDDEMEAAIARRFGLDEGLSPDDPHRERWIHIRVQRFLGYDYVRAVPDWPDFVFHKIDSADATGDRDLRRAARSWVGEGTGPVTDWASFERHPWPTRASIDPRPMEWFAANAPDDMCIVTASGGIFESASFSMGLEGMCYALEDDPALVEAVVERVGETVYAWTDIATDLERVEIFFMGDDMGYRGGLLLAPDVFRRLIIPWHRKLADLVHRKGKLYLLHNCGKIDDLMGDFIEDVRIDAKHSFEDTIQDVRDAKRRYGDRIALIGGIDVDFLCRSDEASIRRRVRETLDVCLPGGGYCLGTGNTVANYIPMASYLAMLDEGRRYGRT
ncbi:MAG: hypothetical protein JXP34_22200 [Planctomycetes bacterium]|nr:hypothetical protein [Planctomycetota bacterium]